MTALIRHINTLGYLVAVDQTRVPQDCPGGEGFESLARRSVSVNPIQLCTPHSKQGLSGKEKLRLAGDPSSNAVLGYIII